MVMQIGKKMKILYLGSNETKFEEKKWTKLKQGLLKRSRKWINWKYNVKILKGNLIIWSKKRWNIEKLVFENLMGLNF